MKRGLCMGGSEEKKTVGILGGMGPEATVELLHRILEATPAQRDQDHIHVLVDSNPKIPDRTSAIFGTGESPLPLMVAAAKNLERVGAGCIIIPCNTAHHWLAELRDAVSIPIVDMIGETAACVAVYRPSLHTIGFLSTAGTLRTGLYQGALTEKGLRVMSPSEEEEETVMHAIKRIKAGDHTVRNEVIAVAQHLVERGAEGVIPGCTELSLVVQRSDFSCPLFDPLSILASHVVQWATNGEG